MASFTDSLVALITTHFDVSLRTEGTKPTACNVAQFTTYDGKKLKFPKDNKGTIAIYPHHAKVLKSNGDDFRDWSLVNQVDVYSYSSEVDVEEIVDAIKEVLDNHQVTGYLKHWWDDEINLTQYGWKISGKIYSLLGESF